MEREKEKSTVIAIMLFVLGVLAIGLSVYAFTYWEYQIVYGDFPPYVWDVPVGVKKVYPLLPLGIVMVCVGAILVMIGILKAKS